MLGHDRLNNRQTKAAACVIAGVAGAVKAAEYGGQVSLGDTNTAVGHPKDGASSGRSQRHGDAAAGAIKLDGVIQDVLNNLSQL